MWENGCGMFDLLMLEIVLVFRFGMLSFLYFLLITASLSKTFQMHSLILMFGAPSGLLVDNFHRFFQGKATPEGVRGQR
jgi:hypothetical protein